MSVWKTLHNPDSGLCLLLKHLSIELPDIVYTSHPVIDQTLFNPHEETQELLRAWLLYRNIDISELTTHNQLVAATTQDLTQRGNESPQFQFFSYDPTLVSQNFLVYWLSWFGIGTTRTRPRSWWEVKSKKIQLLRQTTSTTTAIISTKSVPDKIGELLILRRKISTLMKTLQCVGTIWKQQQKNDPMLTDSASELHTPSSIFVSSLPNTSSLSQWGGMRAKRALAYVLGTAVLMAPIVYNNSTAIAQFKGVHLMDPTFWSTSAQALAVNTASNHIIISLIVGAIGGKVGSSLGINPRLVSNISQTLAMESLSGSKFPIRTIKKGLKAKLQHENYWFLSNLVTVILNSQIYKC